MSAASTALVIGGGIAGPVAAMALARAGLQVSVHEAHAATTPERGASLALAPNGVEALRIVGAHDDVRAAGQPLVGQVVTDERGRLVGEFPPVAGQPPWLGLWRGDLCAALRERARAQGIPCAAGARLVGVVEQPDGVTARFADGSTATADLLVGADGVHSVVRGLIDPVAPGPRVLPLLNFGGASAFAPPARPDAQYFVFGRRAFFGYWVQPDGRTAWFANVPDPAGTSRQAVAATPDDVWLNRLRELFAGEVPAAQVLAHAEPGTFTAIGPLHSMPPVPHWWRGRMVLTGDAVHAPSPSSGQGSAMAIESAVELARCVRDHDDLPAAFSTYERLRRERVERVVVRGDRTTSSKTVSPLGKAVLRRVMPLALRTFLDPERTLGPEQRHRIDWTAPAGPHPRGAPDR